MDPKTEIPRLLRAKTRMEKKLKELDLKIDHVLFRMNEEKRCMTRKCPFDPEEDAHNDEIAGLFDSAIQGQTRMALN